MIEKIINEAFFQSLEMLEIYLKDNVVGAFGGNHKSKLYGSSCEFADYREYIPGDDIRYIDWNVFSRFEKLFLKLFLDERQMHIKIYLDCSSSMDFGEDKKSLCAFKLSIAFAYLSVIAMDKVSVYCLHGSKCTTILNGVVGKEAFYRQISALENVTFSDDSFISDAILDSQTIGKADGMSIIISDFLTDNDYKSAINYMRINHRDVTCIQVLSNEEINPDFKGKNILFDSENKNKYYKKNITKDVIKAYKQALEFIKKDVNDYCISRGVNYMFVNSSEQIEHIILNSAIKKEIVK